MAHVKNQGKSVRRRGATTPETEREVIVLVLREQRACKANVMRIERARRITGHALKHKPLPAAAVLEQWGTPLRTEWRASSRPNVNHFFGFIGFENNRDPVIRGP